MIYCKKKKFGKKRMEKVPLEWGGPTPNGKSHEKFHSFDLFPYWMHELTTLNLKKVSICRSILIKLMEIHRQFVKKRFRVFFSYNPSSWLMNNTVLTENFYFHFMYCTYDYRCCCIPPPGGVLRNCVAKTAGKIHQGPYWSVLCYCRTRPIRISDGKVDKVNEF